MGAALPIEVRQALDRMPAVASEQVASALALAVASEWIQVCGDMAKGREDAVRQTAAKLAAAGIRLVEFTGQDWP